MINLRKHLSRGLCVVAACMTLASVFIIALAKEDEDLEVSNLPSSIQEIEPSPSPSPTPTPMPTQDMTEDSATSVQEPEMTQQPNVTGTIPDNLPTPSVTPSQKADDVMPISTLEPEKEASEDEDVLPSAETIDEPEPPPAPTPNDMPETSVAPSAVPSLEPTMDEQPETTPFPTPEPNEEADEIEEEFPPEETAAEPIPEYPPAWAESGQAYLKGNLVVAEQIRLLQSTLCERIDVIRQAFSMPEYVAVTYDPDNIMDVFAIYAARHGMTDNFPYNVEIGSQSARDELWSIFWDLTHVNGMVKRVGNREVYSIRVTRSSYADVLKRYALTPVQRSVLSGLMANKNVLESQLNNSILSTLSDEEFAQVEMELGDIAGERRTVLLAALSLEGKVRYFWGGKSYYVGWDNRWGQMRTVTSEGSKTTGSGLPFGMDCSGFVSWAFINAGGDRETLRYIGNGTANQWRNSKSIDWNEVQPGDLLFYQNPASPGTNHVGIVVGRDSDGNLRVVHCSSSRNGVVVTGAAGFKYARRPYIYAN